jgi:hypothetical protein
MVLQLQLLLLNPTVGAEAAGAMQHLLLQLNPMDLPLNLVEDTVVLKEVEVEVEVDIQGQVSHNKATVPHNKVMVPRPRVNHNKAMALHNKATVLRVNHPVLDLHKVTELQRVALEVQEAQAVEVIRHQHLSLRTEHLHRSHMDNPVVVTEDPVDPEEEDKVVILDKQQLLASFGDKSYLFLLLCVIHKFKFLSKPLE